MIQAVHKELHKESTVGASGGLPPRCAESCNPKTEENRKGGKPHEMDAQVTSQ